MDQQHTEKLNSILALSSHNPFVTVPTADYELIKAVHADGNYPVSIRCNPLKPTSNVYDDPIPWCNNAYYLSSRPTFTLDPLFHAGAYYVQEASSMFLAHAMLHVLSLVDKVHPLKVVDLCAAPGGKSTLLASLLRERDILVSNEVIQSRAGILVENLTKWGQMNTWVTQNDPKEFAQLPQTFDVMVIDAPCTGSGLWRRDETALDEWSIQHVKLCAERQKRILMDSFSTLKNGGYLIYATCSFSPEEDEWIMDFILSNFSVKALSIPIKEEWNIVKGYSNDKQAEGYHFYPWKLRGEGFFLTVFEKIEATTDDPVKKNKPYKNSSNSPKKATIAESWQDYLNTSIVCKQINDDIFAFHPEQVSFFETLKKTLYVKKAGTLLGQEMGKSLIPAHELALSVHINNDIPSVHVSETEALHYLKKESIKTDDNLKGWLLVKTDGLALGWGKWMPGRMNNYLPKNWRIRMDLNR